MLIVRGLAQQRNYAAAIEEIDALLQIDPEHFDAQLTRATALMAGERDAEGITAFTAISERYPKSTQADFALAVYFHNRGRVDDAARHYEEVLRRAPDHAVAANNLAMLLLDNDRDIDRAGALAAELHKRFPQSAVALDTLGWALFRQGDADAALPHLREATLRAPEQAELHYHLGAALRSTGNREAARKALRSALGLSLDRSNAERARTMLAELDAGEELAPQRPVAHGDELE